MADGVLEEIANAAFASDRGWPSAGGHLRIIFLGSHPDLGNDEFHQFRARRIRDDRHVCEPARRRVAWRRAGGIWVRGCVRALRAWRLCLSFAHSLRAARTDAGTDPFDLRAC